MRDRVSVKVEVGDRVRGRAPVGFEVRVRCKSYQLPPLGHLRWFGNDPIRAVTEFET